MVVPEHLLSLGVDTLVPLCERVRSCTGLYRDAAGDESTEVRPEALTCLCV